jgi:hypothetical protein
MLFIFPGIHLVHLTVNKKLISISFVALIQTIKADPQMINIIYKIWTANDDEQHKDNNNDNTIKYLESNKDNILNLVEKHYKNLVEALANNAIETAPSTSSNPALSMPQSSSALSNLSHNDTYRIEHPDSFHQNKGDIAD